MKPNKKVVLDLIISVGEEKEKVLKNIEKYKVKENVKNEFELSRARVEAESIYLRMKGWEIELYQKILSYIIFDNPIRNLRIKNKSINQVYKQSELWKYGISGDLPIILIKIKDVNDGYVVKEVLKAYEFFRTKNVQTEVVILDEEKHSYENYVREEIEGLVLNEQMSYLKNIKGGIFILNKNETDKKDIEILDFLATIVIDSKYGGLKNNIKELEEEYLEKYKQIGDEIKTQVIANEEGDIDILEDYQNLKYYNEYGAFSENGEEYLIRVNKENRLPSVWCNILANEKFGTIITENMGGYSWYKNSRLNRVSCWQNNSILDIPSEIIYLKDMDNKKSWSLGLNPKPDDKNYNIIYGFGYCKFIHKSDEIKQELEVYVPKEESLKVSILRLKNESINKKKLKLYYYIKTIIGEDEVKSKGNIQVEFDKNNNIVYGKNLYRDEMENTIVYISTSEKINAFTGDKNSFLGRGGVSNPDFLNKVTLNNEGALGRNACLCYEIGVDLDGYETKEISIVLGAEENLMDCKNIAYKYSKIQNCVQELNKVKEYWKELLGRVKINTPLESMNIIMNGWLLYQTISSRLLGRSGYYQSGGAFGFRDQLQDTLGLKYLEPKFLKNQIIKHSKHQFLEGDVEHWWHEETKRGIRTRFSDDLLWLAYITFEYINFTGDNEILNIETPYLQGKILEENQDERYDKYEESNIKGSIYDHILKAIDKSLNFGINGMPKIGSGDWNDGFSTVGNKGKGESVWLGFFLYSILNNIIPICKQKGDEERATKYEEIKNNLKKALNSNGWDRKMVQKGIY